MFYKVDKKIFEKVPNYCVGIIVATDLQDIDDANFSLSYLEKAMAYASEKLGDKPVKESLWITQYREAMERLGINANKYPCSIESLLSRIQAGKTIGSIHPLIDVGNALSIKSGFPIGIHNIDSFLGDMQVRYSKGDDRFDDASPAGKPEPVYVTGNSVRTRNWLWRQTKAGRETTLPAKNMLIVIDGFEQNKHEMLAARDELAHLLKNHFGGKLRLGLVSSKNSFFKLTELTQIEQEVEVEMKLILKGVDQHSDESEIYSRLLRAKKEGKALRIKLGLDPSAPDLHLGHAVVLRKIRQFQDLGHKAVIIFGDFTGMIGDPSGKSKTRVQLSYDQVRENAQSYQDQIFKILDPEKTEIHFNSEWLSKMNFGDVLELCGKITVARILERDDFSTRFKSHTPIGLHEFMYPLMQAYDSVAIQADLEMGGTDQTFNINLGRRIMQLYGLESQLTLFMPLLEGVDGVEKMGKSLGNYIGIYESAAVIYEKVMTIPDGLILKYFNLCTDLHPDEIQLIEESLLSGANPRDIKMRLAYEITLLYCGPSEARDAEKRFISVYQKGEVVEDTPVIEVESGPNLSFSFLSSLSEATGRSKNEIRRLFKQNAVSINGNKITDIQEVLELNDDDVVQIGKGNFFKLKIN